MSGFLKYIGNDKSEIKQALRLSEAAPKKAAKQVKQQPTAPQITAAPEAPTANLDNIAADVLPKLKDLRASVSNYINIMKPLTVENKQKVKATPETKEEISRKEHRLHTLDSKRTRGDVLTKGELSLLDELEAWKKQREIENATASITEISPADIDPATDPRTPVAKKWMYTLIQVQYLIDQAITLTAREQNHE